MAPAHARDDKYWHLIHPKATKSDLRDGMWKFNRIPHPQCTREVMARKLRHYEAGACNYTTWITVELVKAVTDRDIVKRNASRFEKDDLMHILFSADAKRTFPRFTELPPELRVDVYEVHMARFTRTPLSCPTDPPITRASRLLRIEALPVFYKTCTFRLEIETGPAKKTNPTPMRFHKATAKFLKACTPEKIAWLKKLDLAFSLGPSTQCGKFLVGNGTLEISATGGSWHFEFPPFSLGLRSLRSDVIERVAKEDVQGVMDEVAKRQSPLKLTLADLQALAKSRVAGWESLRDG